MTQRVTAREVWLAWRVVEGHILVEWMVWMRAPRVQVQVQVLL